MVEECSELGLEPARIRFDCTDHDIEAAKRLILRKSRWRRWSNGGLTIVLLMVVFYRQPDKDRFTFGVICSVVGFLYLLWRYWPRRKKNEPESTEISEKGIAITMVSSACDLPYSSFESYLESSDLFVLLGRGGNLPVVAIPKQAFPNEKWLTWFRTRVSTLQGGVIRPEKMSEFDQNQQNQPDIIKLTVTLGLRDFLDRALFTWRTWGLLLGLAFLMTSMVGLAAIFPPPRAVNSGAKMFFKFCYSFEIPFFLVMTPLLIAVVTLASWLQRIKNRVTEVLLLSEQGVTAESRRGDAYMSWARFTGYRETWWSFIVWRGFHWVLLPKRCFNSQQDLARCRDILARNVRRSCWFWG